MSVESPNPSRSALTLLITNPKWIKPKSPPGLEFATQLLRTFGLRHAGHIQKGIGKLSSVFISVYNCFNEIQENAATGVVNYAKLVFKKTKPLLSSPYISSGLSEPEIFTMLKLRSYEMLPFHQRMLNYKVCERAYFQTIDNQREKAFDLLISALRIEKHEEKKGVERAEVKEGGFSPQDELALTNLYFSCGALMYEGKPVYFSQLVSMWAGFSKPARERRASLLGKLSAKKWVIKDKNEPINDFLKFKDAHSFKEFLILCSIEAVQKKLKIEFPKILRFFFKVLFANEGLRSDLCYFTSNLRLLYGKDVSGFKRNSVAHLQTLQLFLFIVQTEGVETQHRGTLLMMLFQRSQWKVHDTEGFKDRTLGRIAQKQSEFALAFSGIQELARAITGRQVDFSNLTEEDGSFLLDTHIADTLFFLWRHPRRKAFIDTLSTLARDRRFTLSFRSILEFCLINKNCIRPLLGKLFENANLDVLEKIQELNDIKEVKNAQYLFLAPPNGAEVAAKHALRFKHAKEQTENFIKGIKKYKLPVNKDYLQMLRYWIFSPNPFLFKLLESAEAVGVKNVNREFLFGVMKQQHDPLEGVFSVVANEKAVKISKEIQKEHQFSDVEIFHLYIEIFRLTTKKQEDVIFKMANLVSNLNSFCPSLNKAVVYFIFRYHPSKVEVNNIEKWVKLRGSLINAEEIERFVLSGPYIELVEKAIKFSTELSSSHPNEHSKHSISTKCLLAIISAFHPPYQAVTDHLRLRGISPKGNVIWVDDVRKTHDGLLQMLPDSQIGTYLKWEMQYTTTAWGEESSFPALFLTFFDTKKKEAFSACVPLRVSLAKDKEGVFFSFLEHLGRKMLTEDTNKSSPPSKETLEACAGCFDGAPEILKDAEAMVKEGLINRTQISAVWDFLLKLKKAYRSLYLSCVAGKERPKYRSFKADKMAGLGHIYPSASRGALLPENTLRLQTNKSFYQSDIPPEFAIESMKLFSKTTKEFQPLNLSLNLPKGKLPIQYLVESVEKRIEGKERVQNGEDEKTSRSLGTYVTLKAEGDLSMTLEYPPRVFEDQKKLNAHVEFHGLMLKAHAYRQKY